jgi:protein dithiol:quinone oxidoreductase
MPKWMEFKYTYRNLMAFGAVACLLLLASAYLLEFALGLNPCPLCLLQRYVLWAMVLVFAIAAIHKPKLGKQLYCLILLLLGIIGILLAGRQIWIQSLPPDQVPSCVAGLKRLMEIYPLLDVLKMVIKGTSECTKDTFTLLGFSLAQWSFISFVGLTAFILGIFMQIKKGRI